MQGLAIHIISRVIIVVPVLTIAWAMYQQGRRMVRSLAAPTHVHSCVQEVWITGFNPRSS